ncbi:MAG TPA: hypothetical protein ENN73_00425 [Firmicutes bacterium]|nr:hypothetical protein [Bacillota bacterium]
MIEEFYKISEKPFLNNLDPRFIYNSFNYEEGYARLALNILELNSGLSMITGGIGCGKTTLSTALKRELESRKIPVSLITNPKLSITQLFKKVLEKFGISDPPGSKFKIFSVLENFLEVESVKGHSPVIIIDEAQHLSKPVLEELRLLTNLEDERRKKIQIVLFGQPELKVRVDKMPQIKQRIYLRYHLGPLSETEIEAYINHRLKVSGYKGKELFTSPARAEIFRYTQGVPRIVNTVCMNAMFIGAITKAKEIGPEIVKDIIDDLEG